MLEDLISQVEPEELAACAHATITAAIAEVTASPSGVELELAPTQVALTIEVC